MDVVEKLRSCKKKTITKEELHKVFAVSSDEALFSKIRELEQKQFLKAVKSSKTNGNMCYPIYLKYRITLPEETFEVERDEIRMLHPLLQTGGILNGKPEEYRRFRGQLQALNRYLFQRSGAETAVSRKERSFEIFSQEKQLEDKTLCRLLDKLGLDQKVLAFYDTPEYCFHDFIPEKKAELTLLICENKDPWFNIRRMMFEDHASELWGIYLDGVVYGEGNQISEKEALTAYTEFMGRARVNYLYWGDIDRAGLNIYQSLCRNNPDLEIHLFLPAYEQMIRSARGRVLPDSDDNREIVGNYEEIYSAISQDCRADFERYITENKRLPQEIISYAELKEYMR